MATCFYSYKYSDFPFVYECWYTGKVFMRRVLSYNGYPVSEKGGRRISRQEFLDNCNDLEIVALLDNGDTTWVNENL